MQNKYIVIEVSDRDIEALFAPDLKTAQSIMLDALLETIGCEGRYHVSDDVPFSDVVNLIHAESILDYCEDISSYGASASRHGSDYDWAIFALENTETEES